MAAALHLYTQGMDHADYPPTFILLFEPLAALSPRTAYRIWIGLNVAALAASLFLLLGKDSGLDLRIRLILSALAIFYYPLTVHFHWGQPQLILLLMLLLVRRWLERGREAAAGGMLAIAGLIKIFPLFMVGYLMAARRWRAVFLTAAAMAIGAAATVILIGLPSSIAFVARLTNVFSGGWLAAHQKADSVELVSLGTFVSRIFVGVTGARPGSALDIGRPIAVVIAALALLFVTARATRAKSADRNRDRSCFALWIVTTILLSPTAWIHYMVLLLVPYAELAAAANRREASRRALWMGGASYVLTQLSPGVLTALSILPAAVGGPLAWSWFPCLTLLAYGSAYCLTVD
jgi:hypothetical protein